MMRSIGCWDEQKYLNLLLGNNISKVLDKQGIRTGKESMLLVHVVTSDILNKFQREGLLYVD